MTDGWDVPHRAASAMPGFFGGRGGRVPGFKPKPPADPHAKIAELAKLTCESPPFGTPAPDAELLRALKREVRRDDAAMDRVHDVLLHALAHEECGPRMHAVAVIDQLFHRSHRFRGSILDALDVFLKGAVGVDPDAHPLPGPRRETVRLIDRAVAALASWDAKFGAHLPRLKFALRFANDALGQDAPAARAAAAADAERLRARRESAALLAQWRRVEAGLPGVTSEAREAVAAMRAGVRGVLGGHESPDAAADAAWEDTGEEEWEEVWEDVAGEDVGGSRRGGERVLPTAPREGDLTRDWRTPQHFESTVTVRETPENALALANLRGACRGALGRSVPALADALALLAKLAPEEAGAGEAAVTAAARAATLNELAAVKRELIDWLGRCRSIGIKEAAFEARGADDETGGSEAAEGAEAPAEARDELRASGALVVTVPVAVGGANRAESGVESGTPETSGGGGSALDDLLERGRRRRRGAGARATGAGDPRAPFWMRAQRPNHPTGNPVAGSSGAAASLGSAPPPSSSAPGSASAARARRVLALREASAHNASVMRELGESGVRRRDGATGFGDVARRREEARASRDAALALAESEARDAKRRRNEPTAKQRIEAKLKKLKRGKR